MYINDTLERQRGLDGTAADVSSPPIAISNFAATSTETQSSSLQYDHCRERSDLKAALFNMITAENGVRLKAALFNMITAENGVRLKAALFNMITAENGVRLKAALFNMITAENGELS